jgi:hypothetical protein
MSTFLWGPYKEWMPKATYIQKDCCYFSNKGFITRSSKMNQSIGILWKNLMHMWLCGFFFLGEGSTAFKKFSKGVCVIHEILLVSVKETFLYINMAQFPFVFYHDFKIWFKRMMGGEGGSEYNRSTLYICMKTVQWNPPKTALRRKGKKGG